MSSISLVPAAFVGIAMVALWLLSLAAKDASIVDVFWGLGFVLVAGFSNASDVYQPRRAIVGILVTLWGLRLALHLVLRNRGKGEDPRYVAMRRRWGPRFPVISLVTVFALQGVLMLIVSLPVQVAMRANEPRSITVFDLLGVVLWIIGFTFETVGDLQLTRFKSVKANKGKVMDQGLWRYTRHPNYFGDTVVWWGLGMFALATHTWWALIGPVVMTVLLLRVSGVPLLERRMKRTRPDYGDYAAQTSAFFPMPPRAKERV